MTAVAPWLLIELGWSAKLRPSCGHWTSRSGIRTVGDARYGVPFCLDRLIVLYLAFRASRDGRVFEGNLHQVPGRFGLDWPAANTLERLRRVAHCWYERLQSPDQELGERFAIVDRLAICRETERFTLELSDGFMHEVEAGAPVDETIIRKLARKPNPLDLYVWQATQIHRGEAATVEVFGPHGPFALLRVPTHRIKARDEIRKRNRLVRSLWPESPYRLSRDAETLLYEPSNDQVQQARASQPSEPAGPTCRRVRTEKRQESTRASQCPAPASVPAVVPPVRQSCNGTKPVTPASASAAGIEPAVLGALEEFRANVVGLLRMHSKPAQCASSGAPARTPESPNVTRPSASCSGSMAQRSPQRQATRCTTGEQAHATGSPSRAGRGVRSTRSRADRRVRRARKSKRDQQKQSRRRNR